MGAFYLGDKMKDLMVLFILSFVFVLITIITCVVYCQINDSIVFMFTGFICFIIFSVIFREE
jgi:hypothetical protein